MARSIVLNQVYYDRMGREFIPVKVEKGKLKKPGFNPWADHNARGPRKYTDANGKQFLKHNIFSREQILKQFKNQLREIKRSAKNNGFQNCKNQG